MIIEVQTTQNVTIDYETAGLGQRILAYLIDFAFLVLWVIGCIWILGMISSFGMDSVFAGNLGSIFIFILIFFPVIFYDLLFEILNNGQSLGKMIMKIKVVNIDGTVPSTSSFLIRWLFRLVDFSMTEGFLAVIMVAVTKKSQRLGDLLAGTTVIDLKLNNRNRELHITDLDFHEDYKVSYTDVLDRLSDKDIQTITSIIEDQRMRDSDYFNQRLADRIKAITGYTYDGPDRVFLKKVVSDYNYLAVQE
ncbi:RDD family protein [Dysgonomonas sp. Marseille-P4677]|uniref:RDD family protein n=1 Tax=Dysgonomonas sp. Marseille-P4677 TaxID=2364790 RepID=UPI001913F3FC|nr:RDD family protein [Dysgonomonas sp. Marseille-P4677]MBK5722552.1 RDD family protein [Dysgonomonas sp. Marseille-P4677]